MIDFSQYNCHHDFKSILCLDGELPTKKFFQQFNLPIIAADGAANKLVKMHIDPDLVIGDLDGIDPTLITTLKTLHRPDPDFSDYQKSLVYLREADLLPTIVCGINGGELDHILNNINILMQSRSVIYTAQIIGHVLQANENNSYTLPVNTKISMLGIPHAIVSSKGLKWELNQFAMTFPGKNSCFNRTIQPQVEIQVLSGNLLILIHQQFPLKVREPLK